MSTTNNATKVFTWSSVASGKKKTQAEVEADRAKEREKKAELERTKQEQELRKKLSLQKRDEDFEAQNAVRIAKKAKQEKDYAESLTREKGNWPIELCPRIVEIEGSSVRGWATHRVLEVPQNVNERAMKFIERMLVNYPEVTSTCNTVGEFKQVFMGAYIAYAKKNYGDVAVDEASSSFAQTNANETFVEQGENLQRWAAAEERLYKESEYIKKGWGVIQRPPWVNPLWVFVKNVSFYSCLWAMSELSKTFEMETKTGDAFNTGFVRIASSTLPDSSALTWLTDLSTYRGLPHSAKPECRQKKEAKKRMENEEYGCYSD